MTNRNSRPDHVAPTEPHPDQFPDPTLAPALTIASFVASRPDLTVGQSHFEKHNDAAFAAPEEGRGARRLFRILLSSVQTKRSARVLPHRAAHPLID